MFKKILWCLLFLLSIVGIYCAFNATIIPNVIIYILIFIFILFLVLIYLLLVKKRRRKKKDKDKKKKRRKRIFLNIIGIILTIILIAGNSALIFVYAKSNTFFNKITNIQYERTSYDLIVLNDSDFKYINDLSSIGLYSSELDKNYEEALKKINDKAVVSQNKYTNILLMINDFVSNKIDAIFINEAYIDIITEDVEEFANRIKILDTIDIDKTVDDNTDVDITKLKSFNIYISGIDIEGNINKVSRSDVNIIASVNMDTNKILLTNTPRDYYVELAGTAGSMDKLTHAGLYGVETSIKTLEKLYDTKINYYVRVNFTSLIKIVDSIGGIDVYSDRSFVGASKVYFNYGWNHMDGEKALAYSRTRKVYADGDRHRGRNQQQVIEAIFKKVTKSNNLSYYLNLLTAMEDSFQTNIDKKSFNSLINLQIQNNYQWEFETIGVDGASSSALTYTYPYEYKYVMQPYPDTVEAAKQKIQDVLNASN